MKSLACHVNTDPHVETLTFWLPLTRKTLSWILAAMDAVKDHGTRIAEHIPSGKLLCVEAFDYTLDYSAYMELPEDGLSDWVELEQPADLPEADTRIDCPTVRISDDDVHWTFCLKHGGPETFETPLLLRQEIEELLTEGGACDAVSRM